MVFKKVGVLWQSAKKDKNGKSFMSGVVDEDVTLKSKTKLFVFQTDANRRGPKSPIATVVVGIEEPSFVATVPEPEPEPEPTPIEEPLPEPLPDDDVPF